jgi:hypothetical protein
MEDSGFPSPEKLENIGRTSALKWESHHFEKLAAFRKSCQLWEVIAKFHSGGLTFGYF